MATYLYALYLQSRGISHSSRLISDHLLAGPLRNRNDASVRYRMRNISHVLRERGQPTIRAYSPAPQVGSCVRIRIERILDSYSEQSLDDLFTRESGLPTSERQAVAPDDARANAKEKLKILKSIMDDLEVEIGRLSPDGDIVGIGHNRPPGPIDGPALSGEDLRRAGDLVEELTREIDAEPPDPSSIESKRDILLRFGLKFWSWLGDRLTNFTDAALKILAPILVAKITGVLPHLIDAVEAVGGFLETIVK